METDPLRSCQWSQSSPESSKSLNSPPTITSSLWKQLSEEQDLSEIHFPVFTDSLTEDNVSPSDYDAHSNFLPFSKSQVWKAPSADLDTDVGQIGLRNPWDPIPSTSNRSGNLSYLGSGLPNSVRHSSVITEDTFRKSEKENMFPAYTKAVGNKSSYNALLDKRDSIPLTNDLLPPHQGLSSNVWSSNLKGPFVSSNQNTLTGNECYGLCGNSLPWEPVVHSSLRPPLRDIGNLSNSLPTAPHKIDDHHLIQTPSEFSSHLSSFPFSIPSHDSYSNQQGTTSNFQPQKQHTDLVALMQELSVLTGARDMGNLSYNNSVLSACTSQKPPSTNPVTLSSKGCVFCKNNNYHSTFYKSHVLKDERGHCQCPVLRMYVCPLCNATGDSAHTLKYCPRNTVTRGDPISAGLPPGKVTNWREVANRMMGRYTSNN